MLATVNEVDKMKRVTKYEVNRNRDCKTLGCIHKARIKGLCNSCYDQLRYQNRKNKVK